MTKPSMRISEIYRAISIDKDMSTTEAFALLAAIEFLAGLEGVPVSALNLAAPEFAKKYPRLPADGNHRGLQISQYQKWRRVLLDVQMLYSPGDVDGCPWTSLGRSARLATGGKRQAFLPYLRNALPAGFAPKDLNDQVLEDTEKTVKHRKRTAYRQDVRAFAGLSDFDLVIKSGLMPTNRITPPSLVPGHINHAAMSDEIRAFRNGLVKKEDTLFLDFTNRLAVTSGLLNGKTDTLEDLVASFADLPDPESVGMPSVQANTINDRLTRIRVLTALPDPRLPPVRRAWEHLRAQARKMGCKTDYLWALSQCAEKRDFKPCDLTTRSSELMLHSLATSVDKANFRHGCEQFDACFGKLADDLLPIGRLGIRRLSSAPLKAPKPQKIDNPVNEAWAEFYIRLREKGWRHADIGNKISVLRAIATRHALNPDDINAVRAGELRGYCVRKDLARLNRAIEIFFLLRETMDLDPKAINLPRVRWRTHGGVPEDVLAPLESFIDEMNFAPSSQRAFRVAIGALSDAFDEESLTWKHVLSVDLSSIDWGSHNYQCAVHIAKIESIREWFSLPWTEDWHALQWAISRAGISAIATPVPKILRYTMGCQPSELDLHWARETDRDLRSTINNPPHGRADLAKTLCRNLKALDGLWSVPVLAESGLLPDVIGSVRPQATV